MLKSWSKLELGIHFARNLTKYICIEDKLIKILKKSWKKYG